MCFPLKSQNASPDMSSKKTLDCQKERKRKRGFRSGKKFSTKIGFSVLYGNVERI